MNKINILKSSLAYNESGDFLLILFSWYKRVRYDDMFNINSLK